MESRGQLFGIRTAEIDHMAPFLLPFLRDFERKTGLTTADEVLDQARRQDAQLWSYHDGRAMRGVLATTIRSGIGVRICTIWVCAADDARELVDDVLDDIERWAQSIGCTVMEIVGRSGWERVARGYVKTAVVLEKSLVENRNGH